MVIAGTLFIISLASAWVGIKFGKIVCWLNKPSRYWKRGDTVDPPD